MGVLWEAIARGGYKAVTRLNPPDYTPPSSLNVRIKAGGAVTEVPNNLVGGKNG